MKDLLRIEKEFLHIHLFDYQRSKTEETRQHILKKKRRIKELEKKCQESI